MDGLDREIARARAGMPAHAFFKMNSLTDREVIDKIAEASRAGVRIDMIIRGISCMLPGIEGSTENVHIRSIVGRFLEHARVYSFGEDADTVYLSSADMMTRNTEHRVEIAYPVLDPTCRAMVRDYMADQLRDNVKARELSAQGTWKPVARAEGDEPFNAQEHFMTQAANRARAAEERRAARAVEVERAARDEIAHDAETVNPRAGRRPTRRMPMRRRRNRLPPQRKPTSSTKLSSPKRQTATRVPNRAKRATSSAAGTW